MEEQDLISLTSPAPKEEGKPMEAAVAAPATTPLAESPILPLFSPSPKPQPAATAAAAATTTTAVAPLPPQQTTTALAAEVEAAASPFLPLLSPSPAPAKQPQQPQPQLQTPPSAAPVEEASPILPLFTPSPAPAKGAAAEAPIFPLVSPPLKPQHATNLTPLALASPVSALKTPASSSSSSSSSGSRDFSSASSGGSPQSSSPLLQSSPPASSPRFAGSNASSGPRSKSPLPPRPASASSSPRQRQSAATDITEGPAASYLSPTASSTARSGGVAAAPAPAPATTAAVPAPAPKPAGKAAGPRPVSPKPALGGLREIKEEDTEEDGDGDVVDVDVAAVAAAIAARLMPRGAVRSFDASAGGANRNKPPAIVTSAPAQQQQQQQRLASAAAAASPVYERLHETRLEKDMMDPALAFMTAEHTFRPKRVTEGTEAMFAHVAPPDQAYRQARSIFDRLYDERTERDDYYRQAEKLRLQKEVIGCSFAPRLTATEEFNREHVQTDATAAGGGAKVFERLYNKLHDKQDYYRHYEGVKAQMESQECTFLPAILDTPTVDEEARAALPVWERLQLAGAEIEARREHRRMLAAEQERAKSPFTPAILEKAPLPTEGEAAVLAALAPHERLYKQGQMRLGRAQERQRQKPHGCTFQPQRVAQDTLEGQRKSGQERAEEMYRRGKERVMRDLQRDMATRPPKPRSDEEECTFFPQTNHLKKKT